MIRPLKSPCKRVASVGLHGCRLSAVDAVEDAEGLIAEHDIAVPRLAADRAVVGVQQDLVDVERREVGYEGWPTRADVPGIGAQPVAIHQKAEALPHATAQGRNRSENFQRRSQDFGIQARSSGNQEEALIIAGDLSIGGRAPRKDSPWLSDTPNRRMSQVLPEAGSTGPWEKVTGPRGPVTLAEFAWPRVIAHAPVA